MSDRPSPLTSPDPTTCQLGPGLPGLPAPMILPPFSSQTTTAPLLFLKQDVGAGVAIKVTGRDRMPARPRIVEPDAADHPGAVQCPDDNVAGAVLKQDIGAAVAVEIARPDRMPARPGVPRGCRCR